MDSEAFSPSKDTIKCCKCGCSCSLTTVSSGTWLRSVKRKYDEFEEGNRFFLPGLDHFSVARVQVENECVALREMVSSQQQVIQDLYLEVEEERNASSSAANEAMSMILRLQREKAEIQMEARQFKRFVEEKMAHDQQELSAFDDLLYKREQTIQSLTCEVQAYKHRMMSYGLSEAEAEADVEGERAGISRNMSMNSDAQYDLPTFEYPPLKCNLNETQGALDEDDEVVDIEKYAFGQTSRGREHLKNMESRIYQMEGSPSKSQLDRNFSGGKKALEKVIVGHSPRRSRHCRRFSTDSLRVIKETGPELNESPRFNSNFKKMDYVSPMDEYTNLRKLDNPSEIGDDMSDRVYTVDSVHVRVPNKGATEPKAGVGICEDYITTPSKSLHQADIADPDITKLYMRLQALEADRESMRQTILSMSTDKAQVVLLKEIAQRLCKDMSPETKMPVKRSPHLGSFPVMSIFKWIPSFVSWRKKARRSKYLFGVSPSNPGLLMLLEKGPRMRQWRCLSRTHM